MSFTRNSHTTDRIESGQLAAQVDDEDDNNRLLVSALFEELVDGDTECLSVSGLFLHLFQLSEHLVRAASQPQQRCRVKTTSFLRNCWTATKLR